MAVEPLLTGPRVILTPFEVADGDAIRRYVSKPEVVEFEPGYPTDPEGCRRLAEFFASSEDYLAVRLIGSNELVGHLHHGLRGDRPGIVRNLGFVFDSLFWGQGLAFESCRLVLAHDFANGTAAFHTGTRSDNPRSIRLLERLGFVRVPGDSPEECVFDLLAPEP
ncbi:MAG: GNAT family N-acetyltransferase [Fimbriimonadaceae bacterium]|nr:GNAT family N-acetyltransferase [Fimbriimonadaceae bacterium]